MATEARHWLPGLASRVRAGHGAGLQGLWGERAERGPPPTPSYQTPGPASPHSSVPADHFLPLAKSEPSAIGSRSDPYRVYFSPAQGSFKGCESSTLHMCWGWQRTRGAGMEVGGGRPGISYSSACVVTHKHHQHPAELIFSHRNIVVTRLDATVLDWQCVCMRVSVCACVCMKERDV